MKGLQINMLKAKSFENVLGEEQEDLEKIFQDLQNNNEINKIGYNPHNSIVVILDLPGIIILDQLLKIYYMIKIIIILNYIILVKFIAGILIV